MKHIKEYREFVNELFNDDNAAIVNEAKAFDADVTKMIKQIKSGMGWIDPEFVEETWENISDTIDFGLVQKELYKRLIDAKLLAWPNPDNEEEAGVPVRRLQDVVKESLDEAKDWSKASVSDTLKVAELYAKAIGKADGVKCTVNKKTLESGSFDLDYPGDEYAGGSYYIEANGDVVNAALSGKPVYGKVDSTVDDIVKVIKKLDK